MSMYCGGKVNVDRLVITVKYKGKQADVVNKLTCKTMDVKKRCADECRCDKSQIVKYHDRLSLHQTRQLKKEIGSKSTVFIVISVGFTNIFILVVCCPPLCCFYLLT